MTAQYIHLPNLSQEADIPVNGILSRTLYQDDHVKVVIFGFAEGQELSAHTAPFRAIIHVLDGTARLKLGADTVEAGPGAWIQMEPNLEHGVFAVTPVRLLLTLLKKDR